MTATSIAVAVVGGISPCALGAKARSTNPSRTPAISPWLNRLARSPPSGRRALDRRSSRRGRNDYLELAIRGGFPEAVRRAPSRRDRWFASYLVALTENLVRDISGIERIAERPRIVRACSARSGDEVNVAALASELAIPPRTLDGYLALLANLFVIQLVPAWSTNVSKKVVRRSKLVLADSGLAAHLA